MVRYAGWLLRSRIVILKLSNLFLNTVDLLFESARSII
jgi:hypothetical protein